MTLLRLVRLSAVCFLMLLPAGGERSAAAILAGRVAAQCSPDDTAAAAFNALSVDQRIGQLFMVGLSSVVAAQALDPVIQDQFAGNVVLYGTGWHSLSKVQAATSHVNQEVLAANQQGVAPFIAGNQEGGQVQAFYGDGFSAIPSAYQQAIKYSNNAEALRLQAEQWGEELVLAGVNLNLAPVLDTVPPDMLSTNEPIGRLDREYSTNPQTVSTFGLAFERGMHDVNVAVAIKHFPGLGRVTGNTDFTAEGTVDDVFVGADDPYLDPFKAVINDRDNPLHSGADFVMVSSATYTQVDADNPAMFSYAIITGILRTSLDFAGVIISDDVGAAAAVADVSPADRALRFFEAGGDMVLTVQPSDIAPMAQAVRAKMDEDAAFKSLIEASVCRVLTAKAQYNLLQLPN